MGPFKIRDSLKRFGSTAKHSRFNRKRRGAVIIILRLVAALIAAGMAVYIATPIMYAMKANTALWQSCNNFTECTTIRDNTYLVFANLILPLLGVIIVWGFMSASRAQREDAYDG